MQCEGEHTAITNRYSCIIHHIVTWSIGDLCNEGFAKKIDKPA